MDQSRRVERVPGVPGAPTRSGPGRYGGLAVRWSNVGVAWHQREEALQGRPGTELIPYPFAQSLLPRHTTSGTFAQDPALHVVRRDTEVPAADSRRILPIRLQLLDRHVLVENTPDFGDLKRSIDPLAINLRTRDIDFSSQVRIGVIFEFP